MSAGHVRRRGKASWELKFDDGRDPATGRRRTRYVAFKGTKRAAEVELAKLIAKAAEGAIVDPSKLTVADFIDHWLKNWAETNVSPKTLERYRELLAHVRRQLGGQVLQKLRPAMLADLYAELARTGKVSRKKDGPASPLAARTIGHIHRVLHRALGHAAQWGLVAANVTAVVDPPRVQAREIEIVKADQLKPLLASLKAEPIYPLAIVALGTGMRRGELLALRWQDVDLAAGLIRVERSLETTAAGLRFKSPKTKHGRRTITLPASVASELRQAWKATQEQRLALGLGKAPGDALVFGTVDGAPFDPDGVSKAVKRAAKAAGLPGVTLHSFRHTHASQLIAAGVDVLTISRRLGHGSPTITLAVYGHLMHDSDDRSAAIIEAALKVADEA
jgi:integrase